MGIAGALIAIVGGLLAALPLIGSVSPKAEKSLEKLVPYQGFIGLVLLLWGVWGVVYFVLHLDLLKHAPLFMAVFLAGSLACAAVGFLLGYGLLTQSALTGSPAAQVKAQRARERLVTYQVPLGLLAAGLGVAGLVTQMMH